jgi:GNAT superfamily N-acetyltransferase
MHAVQQREAGAHRTYAWIADEGGQELARLTIEHVTMQLSSGVEARVAAVGNVFTAVPARGRGLARVLMNAVPELAPDADLSVLFGIDGYYVDQGYERAGDEWMYTFEIKDAQSRHSARIDRGAWDELQRAGWSIVEDVSAELAAEHSLLEQHPGTVVRTPEQWRMMTGQADSLMPGANRAGAMTGLLEPGGQLTALAWTDRDHGVCAELRRSLPTGGVLVPELNATTRASAIALLSYLASALPEAQSISVAAHPQSHIARLVDEVDGQEVRTTRQLGGLMVRSLPVARQGVLEALKTSPISLWVPLADRW